MVRLDEKLLLEACRCFDSSNVHRLKEMMFAYERAVELHNAYTQGHERYDATHELELRSYVVTHHVKAIIKQSDDAVKRANSLIRKSSELHAKSKGLEIRAGAATNRGDSETKAN
jgi:hypothetical protein